MSNIQVNEAVQTLFLAHIGRTVTGPEKGTDNVLTYRIVKLDAKIGTMKNGDKVPYVILERADKPSIVLQLHPNVINKLLKTGASDGGLTLVANGDAPMVEAAAEVTTETVTTEEAPAVEVQPTAMVEETTTEQAAEAPAEAPKAPTKKERAIACYKAGHKQGKARKDIIAVFRMAEKDGGLGMGAPGANTYYQNIKSGLWS